MFSVKKYAVSIGVTCILIILEGILSCGLSALENISEKDLKKHKEDGDVKAERALYALELLEKYNNFILIIMTAINIAIGFFYSRRIVFWSALLVEEIGITQFPDAIRIVFEILGMIFLIFFVVLCGNILPRKSALKDTEQKVYRYTGIMLFFLQICKPFTILLDGCVKLFFKLTGKKLSDYEDNVTEEEIISIVNEGLEQGVLENSEVEMISNIIEMDEKEARDIMTRRQKIVAMDGMMTLEEAMNFMLEKSFSRFPVYEGDIDNITGIVFLKDITKYYIQSHDKSVLIREFAKKAYLVPDTKKINVLFEEMQLKKVHMAIAIDEYGQTTGIVAMEDLLEEIVGNISDEFDVDERTIIKQREGKYFMRGLASLEDVAEELNINMDEELEDYDTLNGFLISKIGHIPTVKEKVDILYKGYEFHIVDVKDNTIRFVRVHNQEK